MVKNYFPPIVCFQWNSKKKSYSRSQLYVHFFNSSVFGKKSSCPKQFVHMFWYIFIEVTKSFPDGSSSTKPTFICIHHANQILRKFMFFNENTHTTEKLLVTIDLVLRSIWVKYFIFILHKSLIWHWVYFLTYAIILLTKLLRKIFRKWFI